MYKVGNLQIDKALLLAPMEDVTDASFRILCKEMGADVVFTEFVNTEGLVRKNERTHKKLRIKEYERPIGIQIYGKDLKSMVAGALIAEEENPEMIDINAGCWVKGIAGSGAGAGLVKNPDYLQEIVSSIVKAVKLPVTVKTRIGWDMDSINILDNAKRIEDAGAAALTLHCRTRSQGHSGDADWSWIDKVKEVIKIPVVLNGSVFTGEDAKRAFDTTSADGVMIARAAIGNPFVFIEAKEMALYGEVRTVITNEMRIKACLKHLKLGVEVKGEHKAVIEHRKHYTGYLKSMRNASSVRNNLMAFYEYSKVEEQLLMFLEDIESGNDARLLPKE